MQEMQGHKIQNFPGAILPNTPTNVSLLFNDITYFVPHPSRATERKHKHITASSTAVVHELTVPGFFSLHEII